MRLSLSLRLNLVVGAAVVIAAGLSLFLVASLGGVESRYRSALEGPVRDQSLARQMQVVFKKQVQEWKNILLRGASPRDRERYTAAFHEDRAHVVALADSLARRVSSASTRDSIRAFRVAYAELDTQYSAALLRFEAARGRNPFAIDSLVRGKDRVPTDLIDGIVAQLEQEVDAVVARERSVVARRRVMAGIGVVALLLVLATVSPLLRRVVVAPLKRLQAATSRVAHGDLSDDVGRESDDEIGDLAESFQQMTRALRELVSDIQLGAGRVSTTASDLALSAADVNESMREVATAASSIAEAASHQSENVAQALDATRVVAERAHEIAAESSAAEHAADSVAARTGDGRGASASTQARLHEILAATHAAAPALDSLAEKSRSIQAFTDVVAGIATQSKLLAINAAIEAARAGEHGRGFGVVADEVAKLARESQDALKAIRELALEINATGGEVGTKVSEIRRSVSDGASSFAQLEGTLSSIDAEAKRSTAAAQTIGRATTEQELRSVALSAAMESMAASTEQNAATAQQLSASNEEQAAAMQRVAAVTGSLRDVSAELSARLARFTLPMEVGATL